MDIVAATNALKFVNWDNLVDVEDGFEFAVIAEGEPVIARKVHSEKKYDYDYDRKLVVVVQIGEQFYRRTGWLRNESHCSWDGEESRWHNDITEVRARTETVTLYE